MAVYTELPADLAASLARAHGLGELRGVTGVLAGSVNSNFFLDTDAGRVFARIYEEQDVEGVAYEWALLDHLHAAGLPVPRRVPGPEPGEIRVGGKPTAVFEILAGEEVCQRMVDRHRARALGALLGELHAGAAGFAWRREGRFTRADVRRRLAGVAERARPELTEAVRVLEAVLEEVDDAWDEGLPSGVIHGDLFRDNVRWEDRAVVGVLDWESASDGLRVYDLAVAVLAWCYGDAFDWTLARALVAGYEGERPLEDAERAFLRTALLAGAARFTVTRITDYHLREGAAQVKKDWRRFYGRLSEVRARSADEVAARLT